MDDLRDFDKLPIQDIEALVREGLKSEFWKWFLHMNKKAQVGNDKTLGEAEAMHRLRVTGWDDVVRLIQLNAIYKTREELLDYPNSVLRAIEIQKNTRTTLQRAEKEEN